MDRKRCPEMLGGKPHKFKELTIPEPIDGDRKIVYYCSECGYKKIYDHKGNRIQ